MAAKQGRLARARHYVAFILGAVGSVGIAIASAGFATVKSRPWQHWWPGRLLEVSVVVTAFAGFGVFQELQRANELRDQLAEHDELLRSLRDQISLDRQSFRERVRAYLAEIGEELNFDHEARITVYRHDVSAFAVTARYSTNPEFDKRGRPIYPDNEGLIGKAWREGEAFAQDLPDGADPPGVP